MRTIGIYGATDRFNYGDLLFPLVVEWAIRTHFPGSVTHNFAIDNSDFSKRGALPTTRIKDAFSSGTLHQCDRLIIAGGQVLDARWTAILGYLWGQYADIAFRGTRKLLGEPFTDLVARRRVGLPWPQPFVVPEHGLVPKTSVAYNAVGGAEIDSLRPSYLEALRRGLSDAAYISVRDKCTQDALLRIGIRAELVPDSAIVMSRVFPLPIVKSRLRSDLSVYIEESDGHYLVFQVGAKFLKGREKAIAETVLSIAKEQGLKIMLLAIGTATAHEDHLALAKIRRFLPDSGGVMVNELYDGSLWEIMATIASAALYLGTSLHGAITAMSFGIPRLAFSGEVRKLQEFLQTWDLSVFSSPLPLNGNSALVSQALSLGREARQTVADNVMNVAELGLLKVVGRG